MLMKTAVIMKGVFKIPSSNMLSIKSLTQRDDSPPIYTDKQTNIRQFCLITTTVGLLLDKLHKFCRFYAQQKNLVDLIPKEPSVISHELGGCFNYCYIVEI